MIFQAKVRRRYVSETKSEFNQIPETSIGQFCDVIGSLMPLNRRLVLIYSVTGDSDVAKAVFHSDLNVKIFNLQGQLTKNVTLFLLKTQIM